MGLTELRAFLPEESVRALLDQALAKPQEPALHQALQLVLDPPAYAIDLKPIEGELGPWIEAYTAVLASDRDHSRYLIGRIIRDLARPAGLPALVRLTKPDMAGVVRTAAFATFVKEKRKITAPVEVLVSGAGDSSAKVRTFVHELLPGVAAALPALRAAHAIAKGKQRALLEEAIAVLGGQARVERPATTCDAGLLDQLVVLWRDTRQPEVADLIDLVAAQLPCDPIAARSAAEREVQWLALAKTRSATALGSLFATPWPAKWRDGRDRLDALRTWSDPRIPAALRRTLEAPPYTSQASASFYASLLGLLCDSGDARQQAPLAAMRPALEKLLGSYLTSPEERFVIDGTRFARGLEHAPAVPLTPDQAALLARAHAELGSAAATTRGARRTEAELLAEIYADPDSDAPRLVYADFLNERGDPRGELIVLQCSAHRTEESLRRERTLIARHKDRLVGPLEPYLLEGGRAFERGFLAACRCDVRGFANSANEPAWATIHSLTFAQSYGVDLATFLAGGQGRWLRALHGLRSDTAGLIASERLEELSYFTPEPHAELPRLPNLRRLGIAIDYAQRGSEQALLRGPLWPRLERFTITDGSQRIAYWIDHLATATAMKELVLADTRQRGTLDVLEGWTLTLQPGPKLTIAVELHSKSYWSPVEDLRAVTRDVAKIVVVPSRALAANSQLSAELAAL